VTLQATRRLPLALLASALTLLGAAAHAESGATAQRAAAGGARASDDPKEQAARELFTQGKAKWESAEYEAAISLFSASLAQLPKPSTLTLLADCYERLGRLRSARDTFQRAAELARQTNDERLVQVARTREAALGPRIPQLEIRIINTSAPGLRVTLNGVEVGARWLNVPIPMDAGAYQLEARATGYVPSLLSVRVSNPSTQPAAVQVVQVTLTAESSAKPKAPAEP
jgi:tetratricopeptide (TPR) repeat protein